MQFIDGIGFVEDGDSFYLYGSGSSGLEEYMAVESMSGKVPQYEFGVMGFNHNTSPQYLPPTYVASITNQNDLAALPNGYSNEYEDNYAYANPHHAEYVPTSTVTTAAPTYSVVPSTTTCSYAAVPTTAPAQVRDQSMLFGNMQSSRKRKASVESFQGEAPAPKRAAISISDPSGEYYDVKSEPSPYSSFVPTPTTMSAGFRVVPHYGGSPRATGHQHTTSNASQMSLPATAPYTPTVSPSFTTANTEHSPRAPTTPGARPASVASNPRLVRTSTITQHSPQAVAPTMTLAGVGQSQSFNPYTLFSPDSKAKLHLEGNLDAVAKNWTQEEKDARRKIVVFEREQKGNDIFAHFQVVSQNEWKNHSRSVSCIWWEEKKEAYVTSVDTILLLEGIVAARFTVEEKNRIRRNLEGFKPDTVSKGKPDTEEFFKVIMGFPNPKPRNIEKDVKVFPWKVLSVALQKIISKYSASYASTAGSIQAHPKLYRPAEHEYAYSASPAPEYHGMQMASFPVYEQQGRMSTPATPGPYMHMSHHMQPVHEAHPGYGYAQVPQMSQMPPHSHVQYQPQPMTAPMTAPPPYWHYSGYTTEGQMPMTVASAPPTAYPRDMIQTANFQRGPMNIHAGHH